MESQTTDSEKKKKREKKPLDVMFKEAVGISERHEEIETSSSSEADESEKEIHELNKKLRNLEREIRILKMGDLKVTEKNKMNKKKKTPKIEEEEISTVVSKPMSLYSIFRTKPNSLHPAFVKNLGFKEKSEESTDSEKEQKKREKKPLDHKTQRTKPNSSRFMFVKDSDCEVKSDASSFMFVKDSDCVEKSDASSKQEQVHHESLELKPLQELSPEIVLLVNRLYEDGYLKKSNFLPPNKLDLSCFSSYYSRDFLRFAAEKYGRDHQEIIKSLSDDDLKRIALFGCPSVERRTTFAAKRLRSFFSIQEDILCNLRLAKPLQNGIRVRHPGWNLL
ncbi:hypothetical protein BVC80_8927g16 [Macleaya cordata]|uniref:Uncharacterized protein n=1 Tax=Macleaya cordata TaxID=56857 RepID=A0A200R099_MACCD|nr:hypothetical protein BVC80_8927g16 [Macleaya cordata]